MNEQVKHNTIERILDQALEQKIPATEVQLWPAIEQALGLREKRSYQQDELKRSHARGRNLRLAFGALAMIALLAVVFLTPQGRTWARSLFQFFTPAQSTSFPLESDQIPVEDPALAPTSEAPMPLISLEQAEDQVGFRAGELPTIPAGFEYLGARVYGNVINMEYQAEGMGGSLHITQSQDGYYQSAWDRVPEDAIVPVRIRDLEGEFAQGTFVVLAGEEEATWNANAPILRLRWRQDDLWIEITKHGDVEATEYLDQEGLIALAENMQFGP